MTDEDTLEVRALKHRIRTLERYLKIPDRFAVCDDNIVNKEPAPVMIGYTLPVGLLRIWQIVSEVMIVIFFILFAIATIGGGTP